MILKTLIICFVFNLYCFAQNNQKIDTFPKPNSELTAKNPYENGVTAYNNDNFEEAIKLFEEAIKANQKKFSALFYKAMSLKNLKKFDLAITEFLNLLNIDPTFHFSYLELSYCFFEINDYQAAKLNIDLYLKSNPHSHQAMYQRAKIHFENNSFTLARKDIQAALKIFSSDPNYYVLSGKIHLKLKSKNNACEDFLKAIHLNSNLKYLYDDHCKK